jgi:hypothetical protein
MFGVGIDPTVAPFIVGAWLLVRLVEFIIALRGVEPGQRASIIRALRSSRPLVRRRHSLDP